MTRATDLAAVYEFDMPDRMRKTLRHSSETAASMARYLDVEPESVSRWINGRSIRAVQELLGHVSVATTQVYTAVPDAAKRRAALAASLAA